MSETPKLTFVQIKKFTRSPRFAVGCRISAVWRTVETVAFQPSEWMKCFGTVKSLSPEVLVAWEMPNLSSEPVLVGLPDPALEYMELELSDEAPKQPVFEPPATKQGLLQAEPKTKKKTVTISSQTIIKEIPARSGTPATPPLEPKTSKLTPTLAGVQSLNSAVFFVQFGKDACERNTAARNYGRHPQGAIDADDAFFL